MLGACTMMTSDSSRTYRDWKLRKLSLQLGVYRNETNQQLALAKSVKITQDPPRHSTVDREEGANEKLLQCPSRKSCPLVITALASSLSGWSPNFKIIEPRDLGTDPLSFQLRRSYLNHALKEQNTYTRWGVTDSHLRAVLPVSTS